METTETIPYHRKKSPSRRSISKYIAHNNWDEALRVATMVGSPLTIERVRRKMRAAEMAKELGVTLSAYLKMERGTKDIPNHVLKMLEKGPEKRYSNAITAKQANGRFYLVDKQEETITPISSFQADLLRKLGMEFR